MIIIIILFAKFNVQYVENVDKLLSKSQQQIGLAQQPQKKSGRQNSKNLIDLE